MVWKMSQLPLFLAAWNVFSVVESTTIDLCTDLGPVVQPERCGWCYGVTLVEDDYQFLAPLRHNGGHLWSITTIYYGFSTSPTGHCTPCAEYRSSHSTQLSTCQSQKPPDLRMFQKDARCYDTELVVQIIGGIFKQDQDLLPHPRCYDGVMRSQMMTSQRSHNSSTILQRCSGGCWWRFPWWSPHYRHPNSAMLLARFYPNSAMLLQGFYCLSL